ncbi:ricin-type beta-trefoil lectin domain protein [Streptomyces goshikiensis]|uniref:ricin-type beta-trefoil lectin domain protein n=1 Tax=Streptomyces goshikiensis TaxID=1942 RepID=UPI002E16164E|nr:ricin-type beta-trefoil lectin domain protein [Streptomyces goshikiensis]
MESLLTDPRTSRPRIPRRRPAAALSKLSVAGAAVLSLGAGLLTATPYALAAGSPASAPGGKPVATAEDRALATALEQARSTGKPVLISHLTTGSSQTHATPRGTLTTDATTTVERVKAADGGWKPVDATLRTQGDGTVVPTAVPSSLSFSGGGSAAGGGSGAAGGAMATMDTGDGKRLAVTAPFPLPKPTLDGDSALYRNVLPDIDLRLTANRLGGWRQVLIVHTAQAAANPALKKLHFGVEADGLKVASDSTGNLSVTDDQGRTRFSGPPSLMWDSATADPAPAKSAGIRAQRAATADTEAVRSTPDGPGAGATVANIATTANAQGIDLVPDAALLTGGTGPWYIDPGVNPMVDSATLAWSQVQEAHADTNGYNGTEYGQDKPAAGYCGYVASNPPCSEGRTRAYFKIGINSRIHNATVLDARFYATVVQSSSPSTSTPMGLYATEEISNPTSWNRQPCARATRMGGCPKIGASYNASGTGDISFNVTALMRQAAQGSWSQQTFGLAPDDETNKSYRQRFSNNAHVVTEYDITPTIGSPRTRPAPGFARDGAYADCRTPGAQNPAADAGWVGANTNVTLNVATRSATGRQLQTTFYFWDSDAGGVTETATTPWNGSSGDASSDIGSRLTDGHQYGWHANTTDDTLTSPVTDTCYFRVDRTPPTAAVTSADFPESGTLGGHPKRVGEEGTFTLTGTDPAPISGGRSSGLACARWTTDPVQAAATGWKCTDGESRIVKLTDGKANVRITPQHWGTNYVYLQTQDNAGNLSQHAVYGFYAVSDPSSGAPVYGDVTGDRKADILLPDGAGNLRQIAGGTDPYAAPNARIGSSPSGTGWNGIQITHRGSLGNKPVDDLFAHQPGAPRLYLHRNDENGGRFDGQQQIAVAKPARCVAVDLSPIDCAAHGYGTDWTKTTQIAAFGSPGRATADGGALGRTALLFVENGRLWLSGAGGTDQLGSQSVLLSGNDTRWDGYDLITPGRAQGTDFPTLWARSKTDGTLHAFSVKGSPKAPDLTGFADPAQGAVPGVVIDPGVYPRVGSDGDLTGDGIPDLWAVDANQQLVSFTGTGTAPDGTTVAHPTVTGFVPAAVSLGNLNTPTAQWKLTGPGSGGTVESSVGDYPATANGIGWTASDTIGGRATPYAAFSGGESAIVTSRAVVDTRKSFTFTTWAKVGSAGGIVASQDGRRNSALVLYASPQTKLWSFALAKSDTDGVDQDLTTDGAVNETARFVPDTWTRLTAVYNADTGQMNLYVNGALAATGHHQASTSPAPVGPLALGRFKTNGWPDYYGGFTGGISNAAVYPYAASLTAPGTSSHIPLTDSASNCVDNDGESTADGNRVQIWPCNGTSAQQFEIRDDGTLRVQGKCLDAARGATVNGTPLQIWHCNGTSAQQFLPRADGSVYNPASGRCLDLPGDDTTRGRQLQLYDCNRSFSQRWTIATLGTAPLPIPVP